MPACVTAMQFDTPAADRAHQRLLGRSIEAGLVAARIKEHGEQAAGLPSPCPATLPELDILIAEGRQARDELVLSVGPWLSTLVDRHARHPGIDRDDMMMVALEAALIAADKWDYERSTFMTWCTVWVDGACNEAASVELGRNLAPAGTTQAARRDGREVPATAGAPRLAGLWRGGHTGDLELPSSGHDPTGDAAEKAREAAQHHANLTALRQAIQELTPSQRTVVEMHSGLLPAGPASLREIQAATGMSVRAVQAQELAAHRALAWAIEGRSEARPERVLTDLVDRTGHRVREGQWVRVDIGQKQFHGWVSKDPQRRRFTLTMPDGVTAGLSYALAERAITRATQPEPARSVGIGRAILRQQIPDEPGIDPDNTVAPATTPPCGTYTPIDL